MPDSILHVPRETSGVEDEVGQKKRRKHYLVFFITGNPGLIGYYTTFLSTLHQLLSLPNRFYDADFTVYGQSLPGFEEEKDGDDVPDMELYGLKQVIQIMYQGLLKQRIRTGSRKGESFDGVILIGHSVGSYIALEILREINAQRRNDGQELPRVIEAILLFPTVTHIAQSPSGVKITTLFKIPDFPRKASQLTGWALWPFSRTSLSWLVGLVTGMPREGADVTAGWLGSRKGLWQALHLARDEMKMITEDKWDEEIWGIEGPDPDDIKENENEVKQKAVPKLVFYFGKEDHWVANHTRDALIASRGARGGRGRGSPSKLNPEMLIDSGGVPHGFCLKHSEAIAEKVRAWIDNVVEMDAGS